MSFQAYLDTIQSRTGKSPADLRSFAAERGWTNDAGILRPEVKPGTVVATLKDELQLGHGHAMAVVALLKGNKKEGDA